MSPIKILIVNMLHKVNSGILGHKVNWNSIRKKTFYFCLENAMVKLVGGLQVRPCGMLTADCRWRAGNVLLAG